MYNYATRYFYRLLTAAMVHNNQIFELQSSFHKNVVDFHPVFWSQGCLSAEDPDQLVMVEIEFSTTIDNCVIVVVSVQNPIVLLWEQGDWLNFQLGGFCFDVVLTVRYQTVSFAIEFPRGIPHNVKAPLDVDLLNIGLGARTFRGLERIVVSFNFVPGSEVWKKIQ